jgi:hypothetical protein
MDGHLLDVMGPMQGFARNPQCILKQPSILQELRHTIQGAINKSEGFNKFAQWVSFGAHGILAENNRDDQWRLIKYNHLVADCLIFYKVFAMTKALHKLRREGIHLSAEVLSRLSPYLTSHVNRFGIYHLELDRQLPAIDYKLPILSV